MRGRTGAAFAGLVFLVALGALAWWLGRGAGPGAVTGTIPADVPVVIYLIDTLRADRLGIYGYGKPTSPRLDALAADSVVFDQAYATASWTLPSVASLVTSTHPCEHGLDGNGARLNPVMHTLAERLQEAGYATAAYYQNPFGGPVAGLDQGYQDSIQRNVGESLVPDARRFLQGVGAAPFYLYLHTAEPHQIFGTPQRFMRPFGHVGVDAREAYMVHYNTYRMFFHYDRHKKQPLGTTDTTDGLNDVMNNLRAMRRDVDILYDAAVRFADDELGQTIDLLQETGAWDRVVFIVLADHGEEFDDHEGWFHDQSVYEELIRVPLLIHFPGDAHGGQRIAERVSLLDLMPTILELTGRKSCPECRGSSLMPLVTGTAPERYRGQEFPAVRMNQLGYYRPFKERRGDVNVVMRRDALKGIWNPQPARVEVYDLAKDHGEQHDLAGTEVAFSESVRARADEWLAACRARLVTPIPVEPEEVDDETRRRLRAMGYFQ
jgi:arylsulfatase A-like enzyme